MPRFFTTAPQKLMGLGLLLLAGAAQAHVGPDAGHTATFFNGLAHPVSGMDHLLAMVAVGLWSAVAMPAQRWLAPAVFVGAMTVGALLAHLGLALPLGDSLEWLIAGSVVLLGALLLSGAALPAAAGLALIGTSALFHGTAHGLEMAVGASFVAYGAGFVVATSLLHFGGVGLGVVLHKVRAVLPRVAGALIGGAGVFLLLSHG